MSKANCFVFLFFAILHTVNFSVNIPIKEGIPPPSSRLSFTEYLVGSDAVIAADLFPLFLEAACDTPKAMFKCVSTSPVRRFNVFHH